MFGSIKNFFLRGWEDICAFIIKPVMNLSFYKKCFLIILCGLLLYVPYMNGFNATHDEQYTLLACRFNVWDMIKLLAAEDGHPPLSYLYSKFWIWVFGSDIHRIFALRVATMVVFFLTALLGVFPLRRLLGDKPALLWICAVFVLPAAFYLAMNMRMYPLAMMLISGEFIYAMLFVYRHKKSDLICFCLLTLLALYTHYYCVILSAVIWLIVFVDLLKLKEYRKIYRLFLTGAVIAVLYLPWLFAFFKQYQNMKNTWYVQIGHVFAAIDGAFFSYRKIVDVYDKICIFFGTMCWLLVFEFLADTKKENFERIIAKRAVMTFWSIYVIAFLLSIFMRPNLFAQYMVIPVGLFYLAVVLAVLHFPKFKWIFVLVFVMTFVTGYSEYRLKAQDKVYLDIKHYVTEELPENSLVLYQRSWDHLAMMFLAPDVHIYYTPVQKYIVLFKDEVQKEDEHLENIDRYENFYTVNSNYDFWEYSTCAAEFTSLYDDISSCFKKISKQEALTAIERTKKMREESLNP